MEASCIITIQGIAVHFKLHFLYYDLLVFSVILICMLGSIFLGNQKDFTFFQTWKAHLHIV
jgi:hypothetical protein